MTKSNNENEQSRKLLSDYVDPDRVPLVDGKSIDIDQQIIAQVEAAGEVPLQKYPPDEQLIEPNADNLSDQKTTQHVRDYLLAIPIIAASLRAAKLLKQSCNCRHTQFSRSHERLLALSRLLPLRIPASKAGEMTAWNNVVTFWCNWSGLGFATCASWLGVTLIIENVYQVTGFTGGDWELTQTWFGAFGFTWAFTLGVVVMTSWRLKICALESVDGLLETISRYGLLLAWWGLAGLGLMMGMLHSGEAADGKAVQLFRCLQTVASVLTLAVICVALEWGCEQLFKRAHHGTLVPNREPVELDEQIAVPATKLLKTEQLKQLALGVEERIEQHIRSQELGWISKRDEFRERNKKAREVTAAQEAANSAQLHLANVQDSNAV